MREVFAIAAHWLDEKRKFALATIVELREAATAPIGTTIAVDETGRIFGNIGAGCYESDIVAACMQTATDGQTRRLTIDLTSDDEIFGATACGAGIELLVWRPRPAFATIAREIAAGKEATSLTIDGFVHIFPATDTLILIGATTLAAELATLARRLDYRVVVVDPRPAFATKERIGDAHEIVRAWADEYLPGALSERTPIVVLSHDVKFDLPALRCALQSNAPYIGLLGSRRTQAARRVALQDEGFDEAALARLHGPAGLDLGGVTVAETALSILAEIVAVRRGGEGAPLTRANGAIHRTVCVQ